MSKPQHQPQLNLTSMLGLVWHDYHLTHLFLHYILQENANSMLHRFLMTQIRTRKKKDWIVQVFSDLKELELQEDLDTTRLNSIVPKPIYLWLNYFCIWKCSQKFWPKKFVKKNFWSKICFGSKNFLGQKDFWVKKIVKKMFESKKILGQKIFLVKKIFGSKKFWLEKNLDQKNFW